jgi:hypothetical protein
MENLLIQCWSLLTLQPYVFDIHKDYGQSTSNEKASEVFKCTYDQSIRSAQAHTDVQLKQRK